MWLSSQRSMRSCGEVATWYHVVGFSGCAGGRLAKERLPGRLLVLDAMRKLVWEKINGDGSLAGSGGTLLGYCSLSSGK